VIRGGTSGAARLYDETSGRAMNWSEGEERMVALILQKYPPRSQKDEDVIRLNTYDGCAGTFTFRLERGRWSAICNRRYAIWNIAVH
jgi:hypothetical protein